VHGDENWTICNPDIDALAAEIAAEFAAARRADPQDVWEEVAAAAERGESGYIPVRGSRRATPEESARFREQIAPFMAAKAHELREKKASLGLTDEEEALLCANELWLQPRSSEGGTSGDA
jgi:hypothetical protein